MATITLLVNGTERKTEANPGEYLLYVLRERLGLTGTKFGCGEGECGACTVLIEGNAIRSCTTPAGSAAGRHVTTIEGLAENGKLHPVQQAFLDEEAFQCGYCTPGMIMLASTLLKTNPQPTYQDIVDHMDDNVCRCGTYPRIVAAIQRAAELMRNQHSAAAPGAGAHKPGESDGKK